MLHKKKWNFFCRRHLNTFGRQIPYKLCRFCFRVFKFFVDALSCLVSGGQRALKSSKVVSRFHFTRQIGLNDEYLCKYFSSWKFFWMSLFQFLEMYFIDWCCFYYFVRNSLVALLEALCALVFSLDSYTLSHIFIRVGALAELLFWKNHLLLVFDPIWVRNSPKILSFFICTSSMVTSNWLTSQMKDLQKLHQQHDQQIFLK